MCWFSVIALCSSAPTDATTRILVFPFEAENNVPHWKWLERGLAAEVELRLLRVSSVDVSLHPLYVPREQTLRVARESGVKTFVRGTYRITGDFVEIRAEAVSCETPELARVITSRAPSGQLLRALNDLCASLPVAAQARLLRSESEVLVVPSTSSVQAFETYVEGLSQLTQLQSHSILNPELTTPVVVVFQKAAGIDPAFYGPYLQLGRLHEMNGQTEKAVDAYKEAVKCVSGIRWIEKRIEQLGVKQSE
jgi:hypothetical protein